jgi:hypothetical protein
MQEVMVQDWIDEGELNEGDHLRVEGSPVWLNVSDIPERFHFERRQQRDGPAKDQRQTQTQQADTADRRKIKLAKWIVVGCILVASIPVYSWMRHSRLRDELERCEAYGVVNADVYYDDVFSNDVVVFDLKDGGSYEARRIDPVHLFLQFGTRADLSSVRRVVLARNGRKVFYIDVSDLRPLTESYEGGGRVWAFNNLPGSVATMSGERAYAEWTGGWLGVLQKQTEDLNHFIEQWTGY